jgi:hypothetical protein
MVERLTDVLLAVVGECGEVVDCGLSEDGAVVMGDGR